MRKNMIILSREKKSNIIYIEKRIRVHVMSCDCEYVIMYSYSQSEYAPNEN
jgi:predicted nucleic-acid-binding Zn-ribbon protein